MVNGSRDKSEAGAVDMTNQTPESVIAEVIEYYAGAIGSHWDGCYMAHTVCLAVKLRDMLREPGVSDAATGESEKRAWAIASHLERDRELIKAERDAAVAAIERVRARLQPTLGGTPTGEFADVCGCGKDYFPCDHAAAIIAALDGAPEPEVKP